MAENRGDSARGGPEERLERMERRMNNLQSQESRTTKPPQTLRRRSNQSINKMR